MILAGFITLNKQVLHTHTHTHTHTHARTHAHARTHTQNTHTHTNMHNNTHPHPHPHTLVIPYSVPPSLNSLRASTYSRSEMKLRTEELQTNRVANTDSFRNRPSCLRGIVVEMSTGCKYSWCEIKVRTPTLFTTGLVACVLLL